MTAAESAALDRLIAAAHAHPLAMMASSSQRASYEADARRVARDGLTAREAGKVAKALDTPEERANVQSMLSVLVSKADAVLLLKWLLADVKRALSATDAGGSAPTIPAPAAWAPHAGPVLYLPVTCGWYNGGEDWAHIIEWLRTYRGRVGLNLEATGSTGNHGTRTMYWREAYQSHADTLSQLVRRLAAAGIPSHIVGINSNDFGKGWATNWRDTPENRNAVLAIMRGMAVDLSAVRQWCIVNPVSEEDASMPAALRQACPGVWITAGWERGRLCTAGGIIEHHTGKLENFGGGHLASTDNGPAIEAHFGKGVWTAHTPNVSKCSAYAAHYLARGCHVSLYHRADRMHLLRHRAAYEQIIAASGIQAASGGGTPPPVAPPGSSPGDTGAALTFDWSKVRFKGANVANWSETVKLSGVTIADKITLHSDAGDWKHWPEVLERVKVNANAWILIPAGDGWLATTWEWMRAGQQTKERKNLIPMGLKVGQVYGWFISGLARDNRRNVSERSNVVWAAWK